MPPSNQRRTAIDVGRQFSNAFQRAAASNQVSSTGTPADQERYGWGQAPTLYGNQDLRPRFDQQFQISGGLFSPNFPLVPVEAELARLWDYPVGYNLVYRPRSYEPISFAELRALANNETLTRMAIETRKDQIEKLDWHIKPLDEKNAAKDAPARIKKMELFWRHPDGNRPFAGWLRELIEDMLVIDAPTLEILRNRDGSVRGYDIVDGSTIKVLVDITGRRPVSPAPAYEQVIHGRPWRLFNEDELIYIPRNKRPGHVYGFSPVEQILMFVNIALRRQQTQLYWFCYSDDTEVLTKRGWLRFVDTTEDDYFATRQIDTGLFEWQKSYSRFSAPYSGKMVHFHGRSLDLLVTPEHRMLTDSLPRALGEARGFRKCEHVMTAEQLMLTRTNNIGIPQTASWKGQRIIEKIFKGTNSRSKPVIMNGDDFCAFMGMYLAEGNLHHKGGIAISQPKWDERGAHRTYLELMKKIFGSGVTYSGHQLEVCRIALADYLRQFGKASDKFVPEEILGATCEQLCIFMKYYLLGDGTGGVDGYSEPFSALRAVTVSRKLSDHLIEMAQKLGFAVTSQFKPGGKAIFQGREINKRPQIVLTFGNRKVTRSWKADLVDYDGYVACVSVPNSFLYVRRGGKAAWSGNSEGNLPQGFMNIPELNPEQVARLQQFIDDKLAGNLNERSKFLPLPYGAKWQAVKQPPLKDDFDEWLARVVMFAFSLPPDAFIRQRARAAAESARQSALEEGLAPLMIWVKRLVDQEIQKREGHADLEFAWQDIKDVDPEVQNKIETQYVIKGLKTVDEARDVMGLDPLPDGIGAQPFIVAGNQVIMLKDVEAISSNSANPPPPQVLPPSFGPQKPGEEAHPGPTLGRAPGGGGGPTQPGRGGATAPGDQRHGARGKDPAVGANKLAVSSKDATNKAGTAESTVPRERAMNIESAVIHERDVKVDGGHHHYSTGTAEASSWSGLGADAHRRAALDREARQFLRRHRAARVERDLRKNTPRSRQSAKA